MIPLSVTMAEIYLFGVTSNAGFLTFTPSGAILIPLIWVISMDFLSSMGICSPVSMEKSMVDMGAAT